MVKGLARYVQLSTMNCNDRSPERLMAQLAIRELVRVIKIPIEQWPGNCHAIADAVLKLGGIHGKLQYGMYYGDVHPKSMFCRTKTGGREAIRHGWILCGDKVVDPTRWVFEFVAPYLYVGKLDTSVYDCGMTHIRKLSRLAFDSLDLTFNADSSKLHDVPSHLQPLVARITGHELTQLQTIQLFWVANELPDILGADARSLYEWLHSIGRKTAVPIDFWNQVMD